MKRLTWTTGLTISALLIGGSCAQAANLVADVSADDSARIVGAALMDKQAYGRLEYLTDRIGHRLSGSKAMERAVVWAESEFLRDGMPKVWKESVMVPHWVRGHASAAVTAPTEHQIALLALGGSVATAKGGIEAEVVAVDSFEALEALGSNVRGKIVLYNRQMARGLGTPGGYSDVVELRVHGASRAARLGALGTLVRSLGTIDFRLPHTGGLRYAEDAPKIPSAAVSAEDAMLIQRLIDSGATVRVRLDLGCQTLPDAESHNVLAEIPGREWPDEIVVIGAHLDSWDVGTGAHDDGSGCIAVLETMRILRKLKLTPRRTIRAVLFTNEENGLRGGRDYASRHADEMPRHVAAIESDLGAGRPLGYGITAGPGAVALLQEVANRLSFIDAATVRDGGGGADISPMKPYGVPQIGLMQDPTNYFDIHHTEADTLDKVDPALLDRNVAAMALIAYSLAESSVKLPRIPAEDGE